MLASCSRTKGQLVPLVVGVEVGVAWARWGSQGRRVMGTAHQARCMQQQMGRSSTIISNTQVHGSIRGSGTSSSTGHISSSSRL